MTGYEHAQTEIAAGRAKAHSLWVLLRTAEERDGYALKPNPWEGPGEYQQVSFGDGLGVFVRLPAGRHLPL
jgi:hypothetical protein